MLALQDRLATAIAASFVAQTRFDPLRSADAEQSLYDALPLALTTLQNQTETQIAISGYSARITRDDLRGVGAAYGRMLEPLLPSDTPVVLESPLNLLPGLTLAVTHQNATAEVIASVIADCQSELLQAPEQLALNRRVPIVHSEAKTAETNVLSTDAAPAPAPTHILVGSKAQRIGDTTALANGTVLQRAQAGVTVANASANLRVNSKLAEANQVLEAGDNLDDDTGFTGLLIVVED